jgi:hypothetical protein
MTSSYYPSKSKIAQQEAFNEVLDMGNIQNSIKSEVSVKKKRKGKAFHGEYIVVNKKKKPLRCLRCNKALSVFPHRKTNYCNFCYRFNPEYKKNLSLYLKEYNQRPEIRIKKRLYDRLYNQKPEIRLKRKIYKKIYYQKKKLEGGYAKNDNQEN